MRMIFQVRFNLYGELIGCDFFYVQAQARSDYVCSTVSKAKNLST